MCDYSLESIASRPARVGEKLVIRDFGTGTRGFSGSEDARVAVCLRPGTELSFTQEARTVSLWPWSKVVTRQKTAIFRQVNEDRPAIHHDALEFADGERVLLTHLAVGQEAVVLQLPAVRSGSTVAADAKEPATSA
ncbi:MAG TPA: hypothetical protein VKW08_18280 [Xanthobacteraceae bacterium]|nr:hypothetical protein [Xanthobacteraceae bacterium]